MDPSTIQKHSLESFRARLVRQCHLSLWVDISIWIGLVLAFKGGTCYWEHGYAYITEGASQSMFSAFGASHHTPALSLIYGPLYINSSSAGGADCSNITGGVYTVLWNCSIAWNYTLFFSSKFLDLQAWYICLLLREFLFPIGERWMAHVIVCFDPGIAYIIAFVLEECNWYFHCHLKHKSVHSVVLIAMGDSFAMWCLYNFECFLGYAVLVEPSVNNGRWIIQVMHYGCVFTGLWHQSSMALFSSRRFSNVSVSLLFLVTVIYSAHDSNYQRILLWHRRVGYGQGFLSSFIGRPNALLLAAAAPLWMTFLVYIGMVHSTTYSHGLSTESVSMCGRFKVQSTVAATKTHGMVVSHSAEPFTPVWVEPGDILIRCLLPLLKNILKAEYVQTTTTSISKDPVMESTQAMKSKDPIMDTEIFCSWAWCMYNFFSLWSEFLHKSLLLCGLHTVNDAKFSSHHGLSEYSGFHFLFIDSGTGVSQENLLRKSSGYFSEIRLASTIFLQLRTQSDLRGPGKASATSKWLQSDSLHRYKVLTFLWVIAWVASLSLWIFFRWQQIRRHTLMIPYSLITSTCGSGGVGVQLQWFFLLQLAYRIAYVLALVGQVRGTNSTSGYIYWDTEGPLVYIWWLIAWWASVVPLQLRLA